MKLTGRFTLASTLLKCPLKSEPAVYFFNLALLRCMTLRKILNFVSYLIILIAMLTKLLSSVIVTYRRDQNGGFGREDCLAQCHSDNCVVNTVLCERLDDFK